MLENLIKRIHRLSQSWSVWEFDLDCRFQRSQLEFDLRPKTYIRHVSRVESETLFCRDENLKMGKHSSFLSFFFFEFLWGLSVVAFPVWSHYDFCQVQVRDDDKSASDVAVQETNLKWLVIMRPRLLFFFKKKRGLTKPMVSPLKLSLWCILVTCTTEINLLIISF